MGSIGLIVFAIILWKGLPRGSLAVVLSAATLAWLSISMVMWISRKTVWKYLRIKFF